MHILLTGGAGYIGSHTFVAHREAGFEPEIQDDFRNSSPVVLGRGDVLDTPWVETVLRRHQPASAVHIAGDKAEADVIVTNRVTDGIRDVQDKICTRDLFSGDS